MTGRAIITDEAGLTLIELVLVTVLLALMAGILYSSLDGISRTRNSVESDQGGYQTARYVLARMREELLTKIAEPLRIKRKDGSKAAEGESPNERRLFFAGIDAKSGEADADSLRFVSATGAQPVAGAIGNHGRVELEYRLEEATDSMHDGKKTDDGRGIATFYLIREETPAGVTDEKVLDKKRVVFPLSENITKLNFRYMKNGRWEETWSDSLGTFPEALEISLGVINKGGREEVFRTAVPLGKRTAQTTGFAGFGQ